MKRYLLLFLLLLPLCGAAQNRSFDSFYESHAGREGYRSVQLGRKMMQMMRRDANAQLAVLLDGIRDIRIISAEPPVAGFEAQAREIADRGGYELISRIDEGAQTTLFYFIDGGDRGESELLMLTFDPGNRSHLTSAGVSMCAIFRSWPICNPNDTLNAKKHSATPLCFFRIRDINISGIFCNFATLNFCKIMKTDFLVIGSGAAGLSFALKAADLGHVTIVTKGEMVESNTNYAQGGICSVTYAPDTFEKHIHDTLVCGVGKCNPEAVELVVRRAPELIRDLIAWGVSFDKSSDGRFELHREGGHSEPRILHHEDLTGAEIERALIESVRNHPNITVLNHHFAIDLLTQHHLGEFVTRHTRGLTCFGAYVLNLETNEIETMLSKFTVVATGGCGNIYSTTSNPIVATGDGIAMCHRAKAITENMEFIQFHPTTLYNPGEKPNFLITEAMRGFGAILRLQNGEEFMDKYHSMRSLAPRDVVSRAIFREMTKRGEDFVYLDVTHKDPDLVRRHFPNIYEKCLSIGINITREWIPVTPAAHYCCGGVKVDTNGQTSIKRLYALGEASCTGLHGANRLASNSLLEAVVYADQAARHTAGLLGRVEIQEGIPDWDFEGTQHTEEMLMIIQSKREMQSILSNYVGIVRSNLSLKRAMRRLEILWQENEELYSKIKPNREICELRNMIAIAYLVIKHGREIKESVGCHYNIDYPKEGPA